VHHVLKLIFLLSVPESEPLLRPQISLIARISAVCGNRPTKQLGAANAWKRVIRPFLNIKANLGCLCEGSISLRAAQDAFRGNWTLA
jgi:hypothetical protein